MRGQGLRATDIAKEFCIGRAGVYRVLEAGSECSSFLGGTLYHHRMRAIGIAIDRDGRLPLCKVRPLQAV